MFNFRRNKSRIENTGLRGLSNPQSSLFNPVSSSAVLHLSEMIKCETVFGKEEEFIKFRELIREYYPHISRVCKRELIGGGIVYKWHGKKPDVLNPDMFRHEKYFKNKNFSDSSGLGDESIKSIILMAHYDVVPADSGNWLYPPFSGTTSGGRIRGRGAIDTKSTLCAILESVEILLKQGFEPPCDIYLCFGADEETSGESAEKIAAVLQERGVKPFLVLDEGGAVVDGSIAGIRKPCALVGIAEKGYMEAEFISRGGGGHTSIPTEDNPALVIAEVVRRLSNNPFERRICEPVEAMMKAAVKHTSFRYSLLLKLSPILGVFFGRIMSRALPEINALSRTIGAVTMINGGTAANVIPEEMRAVGNFRILSGESVAETVSAIKKALKGLDIEINILKSAEPSSVSRVGGRGFDILSSAIEKTWGKSEVGSRGESFGCAVIPYLMLAGSDSRSYSIISDSIYRFTPMKMTETDREMIHGINESISYEDFYGMIEFYLNLIRGVDYVDFL